jgi:putative FmdB family regulatory protein
MPIYEYKCQECGKEFSTLVMKQQEEESLACTECGGKNLRKLISVVRVHMSEAERVASYNPEARQDSSFYSDTRNIGLGAKKRAHELGVNLGSQFESKLDKLRTNPRSVLDE